MKKLILAATLLFGANAFADYGYTWLKSADEATIQQAVSDINNGRYPEYKLHDIGECSRFKRKVYAVDVKGPSYRVNRFGELERVGSKAVVKYRCW